MPSAPTRLGDVTYQVQGEGPPIIMLHATLHDGHDFDSIIPTLAKRYQTVAVDWPWHGESKGLPDTKDLSAATLADALEDLMAALALPPAFLIGNSVGGFAAARLAITHPQYVRGLVLVNTGGFADWTLSSRLGCRVLGIPSVNRLLLPSLVPRYMVPLTEEDRRISVQATERARTGGGALVAAALWRSFPTSSGDLRSQGEAIKAPTLIVWGTRDIIFPADAGKAAQKFIPGSRLELLECGHVVFSSKPDEFLRIVESFFESILAENGN